MRRLPAHDSYTTETWALAVLTPAKASRPENNVETPNPPTSSVFPLSPHGVFICVYYQKFNGKREYESQ